MEGEASWKRSSTFESASSVEDDRSESQLLWRQWLCEPQFACGQRKMRWENRCPMSRIGIEGVQGDEHTAVVSTGRIDRAIVDVKDGSIHPEECGVGQVWHGELVSKQ